MMMYPPAYMWTADPHMPPYQQPWPFPPQYHGCCNHTPYNPYTFHPHYSHCPPPRPPFYPHGVYSPFPAPYSVPPQHYSVELPRYDYDKSNNQHHCCGCNHKEDDKTPIIKQESQVDNLKDRPDHPIMWVPRGYTESKDRYSHEPVSLKHPEEHSKQGGNGEVAQEDSKSSNFLVPLLLKDCPIMWVPRGYMESNENEKDEYSDEPVSVKRPEPAKQGGNGEVAQDERGNRFPFRIFWLPSKNDQVTKENNLDQVANKGLLLDEKATKKSEGSGSEGECETSSKHVKQASANEEASSKHAVQRVFPVKQASTNEEASSKHDVQKVFPVRQASENEETTSKKHGVQKVIPVKQVSTNEEKKVPKSIDGMVNSDSVNSDSVEKTDNGSRASPKASKLPPVCLRIDPLPRKKKSSRSPSPGDKERSNGSPVNSPKSSQQQAQVLKKSKEEQSKSDIKTVDHDHKVERTNLAEHVNKDERANLPDHAIKNERANLAYHANKDERPNLVDHANKNERANLVDHGDVSRGKVDQCEKEKVEKKKMLEHEAALIIQSVYHGFEVRKSQPLKKLRQIYEVRKLVGDLRNRIQDLETSSTTSLDGKKAVIIGETIMSLLLKLDTIQGLHPFVREVRKSVTKELVGLQEKLDSLTSVRSETPSEGTMCSPQQVMHPEDDGKFDQAQAQTGLCEIHEQKDTESQYDDNAESCNTPSVEQQLMKSTEDDAIQDKLDQAPTESDTVICENHEVGATVSQEGCNTIGELQLESRNEKFHQAPTERDEALGLCENHEVEATESHKGCNMVGEPQLKLHKERFDQEPTECDEAPRLCESHEMKAAESQEGCNTSGEPQLELHKEKIDQTPNECNEDQGLCENHGVEASESQEGCDNTIGEPQLGSDKEKLDQAPTECDEAQGLCENHEVRATEGCNTIGEPLHEEKFDQAPTECNEAHKENHEVHKDEAPAECDGALKENHEVEGTESHEGCNAVGESHKVKSDQATSECEALGSCEVEARDDGDNNKTQVEMTVESKDLVNVESMMMHDCEADDKKNMQMDTVCENGDERVMEENEKLRLAVEELMKAGNEQMGVIRELTGRVKDLEKKLSKTKKKKVKVNKGRRTRDCVV